MPEEAKPVDPQTDQEAAEEVIQEATATADESPHDASDDEHEHHEPQPENVTTEAGPSTQKKKKKRSKKNKIKSALGMKTDNAEVKEDEKAGSSKAAQKMLSGPALDMLLESNPALEAEVGDAPREKIEEIIREGRLAELLTGLSIGGTNKKDMASYKFWQTQPVPRFDEMSPSDEGPIKIINREEVPTEPSPLIEGFHWVTMDLTDEKELHEVYDLLNGHYVEDHHSLFRFSYSISFLDWALKSPGWRKEWHVGVRATQSGKLVAFISGVPMQLRVRSKTLNSSEINFLCIHKKLRTKRLTPVLIKEITRRCYLGEVWQAIYTAGIILPKPFSTCRYYHRSLNWPKLYDVGFSPLPSSMSKARQIAKYQLPTQTSVNGLRLMEKKDLEAVKSLLDRYLARFDIAPVLDLEELDHWLVGDEKAKERVVWTYVVENPETQTITDMFSFYSLESSVIGNEEHKTVRAAYLFYYATEAAFATNDDNKAGLKKRLNELVHDALIIAKKENFDVLNALTLLDNPLFLADQKFGPGDGRLHYYLYNYRTAPIAGGIDAHEELDQKNCSGVGVVML
ncbi:MAG: glycylpeptide N-tetradecanoyltransferase [Watsoniomyces obsoletus]|nr:MAG: glycylpeptide N-tetradecanoyltransferase [Watsoniomyces obsoletus]